MWQHLPENLNPVAARIGPVAVNWYGIMYLVAFAIVYFLVRYRTRTEKTDFSFATVQDFFPWGIIGVLAGARLGDVLIYDWKYFSTHPLEIFLPFNPADHWRYTGIYGMSYFGGLIGLAVAFFLFCRIKKISLLEFSDLFAPAVPLAFAFGRLGNFVNGEIWGRATSASWGMYFPLDPSGELRHPSQLYEIFLEGILLFLILWPLRKKNLPVGYLTAFYLIGYGLARFAAEFFREPDRIIFSNITIGQIFSISIIVIGLFLIKKNRTAKLAALG